MELSEFSKLIYDFLVKMRCEYEFDTDDYKKIKENIDKKIVEWTELGCVPNSDVVAIIGLVNELSGGNRFFDEMTAMKVEDASIEIMEMLESGLTETD